MCGTRNEWNLSFCSQVAVGLFKNRSQGSRNMARISDTLGCTSHTSSLFLPPLRSCSKWATLQSHINSVERYIQSKKLEILTSLQTPSSHVGLHPIFPQLWGMRQDEVSHSDNLRFQQFRRTSHESQLLSELFNVMNSKVNNTNILWRYLTLYLNVLSSFPVVCVNVPNTRADFSWHVHITSRSN